MLVRIRFPFLAATIGLAALGALAWTAPAQAQGGVKAGVLKCNVASGFGFIFGSSKELRCVFGPEGGAKAQRYRGKIQKFGVDIGYTTAGVIIWIVFAPTTNLDHGALAGSYAGATAEITAGIGLGANVLVGGGNSIALQPLSITGQTGLNIAAGIATVVLEAAN